MNPWSFSSPRRLLRSLALILAAFASAAADETRKGDDRIAAVEAYVRRWHEVGRFHGVALVARDGDVVLEKGYGLANREWDVPNAPGTRFKIHSISKQFTCVMVLQLAAEGALALDDVLTEHLPAYRADTGGKATIDHLLRHTAGIPCYINDGNLQPEGLPEYRWENTYRPDEIVRDFMSGDLKYEPGARYSYSNSGYYLLARVIEAVSGLSYEENLRRRILEPLGLKDTGVDRQCEVLPRRARGYSKAPGGWVNVPFDNPDNLLGAGNLYSTARDLLRWNLALENAEVLPEEWRDRMFAVHTAEPHVGHAYSLEHFQARGPADTSSAYTSFSGGGPGFCTDVIRFPGARVIVVLLDNSSQYNHWRMAPDILRLLEGGEVPPPLPLVSDAVCETALRDGIETAVLRFRELERGDWTGHEPGDAEGELNAMGYAALRAGHGEDAVTVFRLNRELFPDSWNVYDSLAEALRASGRSAEAEELQARADRMRSEVARLIDHLGSRDFAAARALLAEVRERDPERVVLPDQRLGPMFEEAFFAGDDAGALSLCEIWALASPSAPGPWFCRARVHERRGEVEEARECFRKVLSIQPEGAAAQAARRRLNDA